MKLPAIMLALALASCASYEADEIAEQLAAEGVDVPLIVHQKLTTYNTLFGSSGVALQFNTYSEQPLKYVRFYIVPFDRVNERVVDPLTGLTVFTTRLTGPYDNGGFEMADSDTIWGTLVDHVCIDVIVVTYMDDTQEVFVGEEADRLVLPSAREDCRNRSDERMAAPEEVVES